MGDLDLVLPDTHRLDQYHVVAGGVEGGDHIAGGTGEAAQVAARGHAAHEDARVAEQVLHADAVAEDRAAAEGARRIDRGDANRPVAAAIGLGELVDERALAAAGRARDADNAGTAGLGVEGLERRARLGGLVLDAGEQAGEAAAVAGEDALGERLAQFCVPRAQART
jgi:hypothetical protein